MTTARWAVYGGVVAGMVLAASAAHTCMTRPPAITQVTDGKRDGSWGSTSHMESTLTRQRGRVTRERYDPQGHITERTTIDPSSSITSTRAVTREEGAFHETTHTETTQHPSVALRPRWRVSVGAEWTARDFCARPNIVGEVEYRAVGMGPISIRPYAGVVLDSRNNVDVRAGARMVLEVP